MNTANGKDSRPLLNAICIGVVLFWSVLILALAGWNYWTSYAATFAAARSSAYESFSKDLVYQRWAAMHGGIYVPITPETPPNPYLSRIPERDIRTPSGRKLTLMTPDYMTRQVHELIEKDSGLRDHLTSLKPLRTENAPDEWERRALQAFAEGRQEVLSLEVLGGKPYLRFMRPLITETGCLKCHAAQGYKGGDIRGGISVSVPWEPFRAALHAHRHVIVVTYGGIWIIGLIGLLLSRNRLQDHFSRRRQAEEALRKSEQEARRLAQENELVAEIARIISATPDIEEVYERFAEKVREAIPFDRIAVNTVNRKDYTRTVRYAQGDRFSGERRGMVVSLVGTGTEEAVRTKSSLLINSRNREKMCRKLPGVSSLQFGAQSSMIIPLIAKDAVIGALAVHSATPDAYSEQDLALAERVGAQIAGTIANAQLLLERRQAQEALKKNNLDLTAIIDNLPFLAWLKDAEGRFITVNELFARSCGRSSPGELVGKTDLDIWPPDLAAAYRADDLEVMRTGQKKAVEESIADQGGGKWFETYKAPLFDVNGAVSGTTGIARDITDRKQAEEEKRSMEERLHRAEKMEALGTLAGGVAHDLNNVLGVLMGYSEMLMDEIPQEDRRRTYVDNILKSTAKGASIIQDLLTLARRGVSVAKPINLNDTVSDFLKGPVFERLRADHPRVTFRTELDRGLLNIKGSPVHLEKTVMNLIRNAAEAIEGEGTVIIRTGNHYLDRPIGNYDQVEEGEYAVLTISDNGGGIRPEDLGKIFEPFYTKKVMGRSGTGLGLAVIWGTVKDHHGYIDLASEYGKGSTFTLYFPITRDAVEGDLRGIARERYQGKGESILVVDDVREQREMAAMMLKGLGYRVRTVASGEEAVDYLKTHTADLLVLDMIMDPGLDGLETYRQVRKIRPRQKAILVSGFSETERVKTAQELGAGPYVKKPYIAETIALAVRRELDRPA